MIEQTITVYVCECRLCGLIEYVDDEPARRHWLFWYANQHERNAGREHRTALRRMNRDEAERDAATAPRSEGSDEDERASDLPHVRQYRMGHDEAGRRRRARRFLHLLPRPART